MSRSDLSIEIAGVAVTLLGEGAAWLDAAAALLIGDLHLGRSTSRQRAGLALPGGSDEHDVDRLERLAARLAPRRVVLLGDVLHARSGVNADAHSLLARLGSIAPGSVTALPGNHDARYLAQAADGTGVRVVGTTLTLGGARLTHRPRSRPPTAGAPLRIAAHEHPAVVLGRGHDRVKVPAFVVGHRQLIVPAFGTTAAGAVVKPGSGLRVFAATGTQVVEVPGSRRVPG